VKQICGGMAKEIRFQPRVVSLLSEMNVMRKKRHLCAQKAQPDSRLFQFISKLLL